ncbi:AraC family transcriptional regulator, partial [Bradyrhizobium sp. STM 3809]|uniref:helix-turn-helix domain-containing protein n=1 Tax=Bradyrhizobium sp. STM 3809 TaxID=551936 RepID=UPI0005553EFD
YRIEKRYVRPDDSVVWGRVMVNPIRDAAGRIKWICAVVEDITATKILETQLAAAEKLAGLSTFNLIVTAEDRRPESGAPCAGSLGEILTGVHQEDRDGLEEAIERAIAKRTGYTREYRVIDGAGTARWVRGMGTCVYSPTEGRLHLVGAVVDVTATRQQQDMPEPIRRMLDHVELHWQQKASIEQLAAQFGISPRAVYQYFSTSGMSLGERIKQIRMQHARRMLCAPEPGATVMSIALRCGFSNPGHFAKEYRKVYGETPSESLRRASSPN